MANNMEGRSGMPLAIRSIARSVLRKIHVHENVRYGRNLRVGRRAVVSSPHGLTIGDHVSIGPNSVVQVNGTIGDFVLIGMFVQIVGRDDHARDEIGTPIVLSTWVADRAPTERDSIHIERDVWIGGGSIVLSGVRIGEGAIVGSGSIVTRDVPPYSIVAGSPAREIARRFGSAEDERAHSDGLNALSSSKFG